jgi:hypothetical protein
VTGVRFHGLSSFGVGLVLASLFVTFIVFVLMSWLDELTVFVAMSSMLSIVVLLAASVVQIKVFVLESMLLIWSVLVLVWAVLGRVGAASEELIGSSSLLSMSTVEEISASPTTAVMPPYLLI